jgi:hypothetical protein
MKKAALADRRGSQFGNQSEGPQVFASQSRPDASTRRRMAA